MKYIRQFAVILGISFLGEILHYLIPVSDTGKRIWTDPYVPASGTRDLKDRRRP